MITRIGANHLLLCAGILAVAKMIPAAPPAATYAPPQEVVKKNNVTTSVSAVDRLGEMITIPAGRFVMGNNGHEGFEGPEEFPQHTVNLAVGRCVGSRKMQQRRGSQLCRGRIQGESKCAGGQAIRRSQSLWVPGYGR